MGMGDNAPVSIMEDNQACMEIASKDIVSPKLKHVDIRYHIVRTMLHEVRLGISKEMAISIFFISGISISIYFDIGHLNIDIF